MWDPGKCCSPVSQGERSQESEPWTGAWCAEVLGSSPSVERKRGKGNQACETVISDLRPPSCEKTKS